MIDLFNRFVDNWLSPLPLYAPRLSLNFNSPGALRPRSDFDSRLCFSSGLLSIIPDSSNYTEPVSIVPISKQTGTTAAPVLSFHQQYIYERVVVDL